MSLLFAGCPIHKGEEIKVAEKCFNCEYFLGKVNLCYTVDRWCSHPEIGKRLDKIREVITPPIKFPPDEVYGLPDWKEKIKERTIKWISLEAEVMSEIQEMIEDKKISKDEWHTFLKKIVEEYGTKDMLRNLERQLSLLEFLGQIIKKERKEI